MTALPIPLPEPFFTLFQILIFPGLLFALLFVMFMVWYERKLLAKMQVRVGPLYAGGFGGILQPIADFAKLLFKEIIVPRQADQLFFVLAPTLMMALSVSMLALVPLSPTSAIANSNVAVLMIVAILSLSPLIVIVAGWASNNKYSMIGGLRALHQMTSYAIPLSLSILGVVLMAGSFSLISIVESQKNVWFILLQPLGAIVFYLAALAELERVPFDIPEAETEIVMGWETEYSGINYGLIMTATYVKFYALAVLFTELFLGGWLGPAFIPASIWTILKTFVVVTAMMIPRGVYPRFRIDQMLRFGWTTLLPLSLINLVLGLVVMSILG
jgi:NADH-quinone oxidoreductase subunit H